jgi:RimJ/RimL family protein N-acetyltransferase
MLRPATDDDLAAMLAWRNQAANREVSNHSHVITPEEHAAWWGRVQADPSRLVYLFEVDGRPLGVVSYFDLDPAARTGAWGFYLDHDTVAAEGLAMTAWMKVMGEAVDQAFDQLGLDTLTGEVLAHNEAVRLMNRRFRFTEGTPEERLVDDRTITVIPISLARADRRTKRGS